MTRLEAILRKLGRWVLLFAFVSIVTLTLIEVDVIVQVPGKLEPQGRVTMVQAEQDGQIVAMHVSNGDLVQAGEPLFELNQVEIAAELASIDVRSDSLVREEQRLRYLLCRFNESDCTQNELAAPEVALAETAFSYIQQRIETHRMEQQLLETESETANVLMLNLSAQINIVTERLTMVKELAERVTTVREIREIELQILELNRLRLEYAGRIAETERMRQQIEVEINTLRISQIEQWQTRLDTVSAELAVLQQRQRQLSQRREGFVVEASRSGIVTGLAEDMIGRVVNRADNLLSIVPQNQRLVVASTVPSKDIAFVRTNQTAVIKVDAYPYQRFGSLNGEVTYVSADASLGSGDIWLYDVVLRLVPTQDDRTVTLKPGMTVQVDLILGQRRLASYFLDPLIKAFNESYREP